MCAHPAKTVRKLWSINAFQEVLIMPSIFNVLVCILALLIGILIGEKYRKWKKNREENNKKRREGDDDAPGAAD